MRRSPFVIIIICAIFSLYPPVILGNSSVHADAIKTCKGGAFLEVLIEQGNTQIRPLRSNDFKGFKNIEVPSFCISESEVSVKKYAECVADGVCPSLRGEQNNLDLPVHSITYTEVNTFVSWLKAKYGLPYRLPSEAEWQLAALSGSNDEFPWRTVGQFPKVNIFSEKLSEVGENSRNEFGVRDTIGNLSEVVADCYQSDLSKIPSDGTAFHENGCKYRITKGGNYSSPSFLLNPYFRARIPSDFASQQIGIRLVRSLRDKEK